jgi:glutathione S-transferase
MTAGAAGVPLDQLTVWGRRAAFNVQKVLWGIEELGLEVEQVDAGQHYGRNREPAFLAMNPNGRIPVLQAGNFTLWESNAILRFLCAKAGTGAMGRDDALQWARADQWMDWVATTLYYPTFRTYFMYARGPATGKDPARVAAMAREVHDILRIAESQLEASAWLAGPHFTMADLAFGVVVDKWTQLDPGRSAFPSLLRYHSALEQRPAFIRHVARFAPDAV